MPGSASATVVFQRNLPASTSTPTSVAVMLFVQEPMCHTSSVVTFVSRSTRRLPVAPMAMMRPSSTTAEATAGNEFFTRSPSSAAEMSRGPAKQRSVSARKMQARGNMARHRSRDAAKYTASRRVSAQPAGAEQSCGMNHADFVGKEHCLRIGTTFNAVKCNGAMPVTDRHEVTTDTDNASAALHACLLSKPGR